MSKRVISIVCLLALVCALFVACGKDDAGKNDNNTTTAAATKAAEDSTKENSGLALQEWEDLVVDYAAGAKDPENCKFGEYGFFGPYPDMDPDTLAPIVEDNAFYKLDTEEGMIFDIEPKDSWFTSQLSPQEIGHYKYVKILAKTDDPEGIEGFTMTFGSHGQGWQSWIDADGKNLTPLTTEFQTYVVDLDASGVKSLIGGVDIAMNQGAGKHGHVYVKSFTFTNTK